MVKNTAILSNITVVCDVSNTILNIFLSAVYLILVISGFLYIILPYLIYSMIII